MSKQPRTSKKTQEGSKEDSRHEEAVVEEADDTAVGAHTRSQAQLVEAMKNLVAYQTQILEQQRKDREELEREREAEVERRAKDWEFRTQELQLKSKELEQLQERARLEEERERDRRKAFEQQEADRRAHENNLIQKQMDLENLRRTRERKSRLADKVEPLKDSDQPEAYFRKFETVMQEADIPAGEWAQRFIPLLTGKALTAFSTYVSTDAAKQYNTLKEALLIAMGLSLDQCRREFWNYQKRYGDSPQEVVRQLEAMVSRLTKDCRSVEETKREFLMGRFLSQYPPDAVEYVQLRIPKTPMEAANMLQEHFRGRQQWRERKPHQVRPWSRPMDRAAGGLRELERKAEPTEGASRETDTTRESPRYGGMRNGGRSSPRQSRVDQDNPRTPTCFACGKKGHKRPECPSRMARCGSPGSSQSPRVEGTLCGKTCMMLVDTGAEKTVVAARLVQPKDYLKQTILLAGYDGKVSRRPLARVWLEVGEYSMPITAAVLEEAPEDVYLGVDLGLTKYLLELEEKQVEERERRCIAVVTRAQEREQGEQDKVDEELNVRDEADPLALDVLPMEGESESEDENSRELSVEQSVEDLVEEAGQDLVEVPDAEAVTVNLDDVDNGWDGQELPLPQLCLDEEDRGLLIKQQEQDDSLEAVRSWAEKSERGYAWKRGLLVHDLEGELGEIIERVVVPKVRREQVMRMGHSSLLSGHFSHRKTAAALRRSFTWPGISKDVRKCCQTCPECQKAAKPRLHRAPLRPLPVIDTPFTRIAFDLVGPLPRTKQGHKYLLTSMCLGSKYPEAVPLKCVDAKTVAEAMLEVFSRTGIPKEILSDQGSVFMSKLMKELCSLLGVKQLRTSPYHPQTDGCLERWHGSLKCMLRKCVERRTEWDRLIKYLLFAYRNSPHSNTGFSPFEVIYGRVVRGPLDVLRESWVSGETKSVNVVQWINQLSERLCEMSEVVCSREKEAKVKMKVQYDKRAKEREVELGTLVLVRTPDLSGKLEDSWDGPYEVIRKVSDVTYELAVPSRRSKRMVAHINMIKIWHSPEAQVLRLVVAEEEEEEDMRKLEVHESELKEEQRKQLQELLVEFGDVVNTSVGKMCGVEHSIDTGKHPAIRSVPYRLAPAWKDQLREEVRSLLEADILTPSHSPWSSPMVPVRKPDGSVRLCIDYRKVNAITVPDPYTIPLIDELLDQVGDACYLSKLDLNKGFYQVPVKVEDRPKTAFCCPWGKYEFKRMPFVLRNAPATFQRAMHQVLEGLESFSGSYIDDLIIFSQSWEEHVVHLTEVLSRLRTFGLTAKPSKCEWGAASLTYLGHLVGKGRVAVPEQRVEAIRHYKRPVTKTDLRAFLGTLGYYRRFVKDYSSVAFPLTEATKKAAPNIVSWNTDMLYAFNSLCSALCDAVVLFLPSVRDELVLQTDASGRGVGAVLSVLRSGEELPVGYYSRKLRPQETRYAATELECLAVVSAVQHFAVYLVGMPFRVQTDHRALEYLQSSRHLNGRLTRWALALQPYTFTVEYRPGKQNANADGLSRQAWPQEEQQELQEAQRPRTSGLEGGGRCQAQGLKKNIGTVVCAYSYL